MLQTQPRVQGLGGGRQEVEPAVEPGDFFGFNFTLMAICHFTYWYIVSINHSIIAQQCKIRPYTTHAHILLTRCVQPCQIIAKMQPQECIPLLPQNPS